MAREVMRVQHNTRIHPMGDMSFNLAARRASEWRVIPVVRRRRSVTARDARHAGQYARGKDLNHSRSVSSRQSIDPRTAGTFRKQPFVGVGAHWRDLAHGRQSAPPDVGRRWLLLTIGHTVGESTPSQARTTATRFAKAIRR